MASSRWLLAHGLSDLQHFVLLLFAWNLFWPQLIRPTDMNNRNTCWSHHDIFVELFLTHVLLLRFEEWILFWCRLKRAQYIDLHCIMFLLHTGFTSKKHFQAYTSLRCYYSTSKWRLGAYMKHNDTVNNLSYCTLVLTIDFLWKASGQKTCRLH